MPRAPDQRSEGLLRRSPRAILPVGGHKGFGLGVMVEMLAGALTGGGCSRLGLSQLEQALFTITIDPAPLSARGCLCRRSPTIHRVRQKLAHGVAGRRDPHAGRARGAHPRHATRDGIELDDTTWGQITAAAKSLGISEQDAQAILASKWVPELTAGTAS